LIRAVVDTNILIRAMIKTQGSVGPIITALRSRLFTLVLSEPLLEELLATMALPRIRGKYHLTDQDTRDYVAFLSLHSLLVEPPHTLSVCRDESDNKVLEAALAGGADFIVTSDGDLLVLDPFEGIRIVPAARFLKGLSEACGSPARF
jgi:putative PIN family toxin of toxin-antitoxin system